MRRMHLSLVVLAALVLGLVQGAPVHAAPTWAPAATATIHPGVQTVTLDTTTDDPADGGQCTANFVYADAGAVYLGQAAHCAGLGLPTDTDGCNSGSLPLGTPVAIDGASRPGTLVYSSWLTMQARGETDPETCAYNDLALVRIDPADVASVNPSLPFFGGPVAVGDSETAGEDVYSYGNSSLRRGIKRLSPKSGISVGDSPAGWSHTVYTASPGVPGDSGSGFLDAGGKAVGVLSTVAVLPLPASNGVSDLARALAYLHAYGGPVRGAQLVAGTEPFTPRLPVG